MSKMRFKTPKASEYWRNLNHVLDEIYDKADELKMSLRDMAEVSGLHYQTVWMIQQRKTLYPQYVTVSQLADAVGLCLQTEMKKQKRKAG